jgi:hypothetical protein
MKIHFDKQTPPQICITWAQAEGDGCEKRAWVQHRTDGNDWASTGRYINVVRVVGGRPAGNPTDFPIRHSDAISDREALIAFVLGVGGDGTTAHNEDKAA